ncbi:hypothetical protein Y71_03220 [Kosakonia radicincitans DSM 16656]|uniref:DUF4062 domain-containing protein n=1 Tax=Kosakonia radicincitans TaxID=283686 RepID=UPI000272E9E4|nr:DUF4062 domain-containing protein [Kosakonia radicincitans]ARD58974.1 hypothetical protein Y71_03220 [Kosakonia radicincitans DSM 16656]
MDEKKYQIFVSSTYVDLIEARKKIIETVLNLYHFPVGMEMFSADDSEQWEIIKETIDASDYYIVIIGHKYGSISPSTGISYTEMEYDYAKSIGVPVLAFIRERDVLTSPDEREADFSKTERLNSFIDKAQSSKVCDFWISLEDLATKVAVALPKIMRRKPRVGWVRGNQLISTEVSNELAGLSTENRDLRKKLRELESQLSTDVPVLALVGINQDFLFGFNNKVETLDYYEPVTWKDIPESLIEELTDTDLDEFNGNLPQNNVIDKYNRSLILYTNRLENFITVTPVLENKGRKVATDIYVEIELPEFIVALNDSNEGFFKSPPVINLPLHPIEIAEKRAKARRIFNFIGTERVKMNEGDFIDGKGVFLNAQSRIMPRIYRKDASSWVNYERNCITLRAKKLLQSLSLKFDDITLFPIKEGEGVIKFKIICEEIKEPIYFTHQVTVAGDK